MENDTLVYGALIGGLLGFVLFFYLLEATIIQALKKFKKWEADEMAHKEK